MKWRIAVIGAVGFLFAMAGCEKESPKPAQEQKQATPQKKVTDKAKDPVCGMTVEKVKALAAVYKMKVFYFCSEGDRQKFQKEPSAYPTGLPGEKCACTKEMPNCKCGHCEGKNEECECGEEEEHKHEH